MTSNGFVLQEVITPWGFPIAVTIYRKEVRHRTAKNFQLDLFDPNDGYYEYSAVAGNLSLTMRNLWHFMAGRGNHEKTIAHLKSGLAFHTVPTNGDAANSEKALGRGALSFVDPSPFLHFTGLSARPCSPPSGTIQTLASAPTSIRSPPPTARA